jgi:flavin-binding protein dodecin
MSHHAAKGDEAVSDGDKSNKGKSTDSLQKAIEDAGKNAATTGPHTVTITVEVGNPKISEYRVKLTPGG